MHSTGVRKRGLRRGLSPIDIHVSLPSPMAANDLEYSLNSELTLFFSKASTTRLACDSVCPATPYQSKVSFHVVAVMN
ncbi:hypothetical protein BDW59DRAFT_105476 [Aspergillus cavernicola]|uniref:Uncharacterized protein n=1 Tax=Aspergillus cavernicola TaxID=176166 RepID=A0ABR4IXH4_9EURO